MASRKGTAPEGFLTVLKAFWAGLGARSHRIWQVIDEALSSDNLKDKIWAVDWLFKHLPVAEPEAKATRAKRGEKPIPLPELEAMSEEELLTRIRHHLKDWEPD